MTTSLRIAYVTFCLAVAFVVWLFAYGMALQFLYHDARVLRTTITTNPFAPILQLVLYADNPVLQRVALGAVIPAILIAGGIAYAGLRSRSNPLGDARFQTAVSLRHGKWFGRKGHILGRFGRRLLRVSDERHHLHVGWRDSR